MTITDLQMVEVIVTEEAPHQAPRIIERLRETFIPEPEPPKEPE